MAEAVELALAASQQAVIEAPVGTGKSFAYLIPALLSDKRVVISTATHALQSQLIEKDLPYLQKTFPHKTFAAAKGKENFVCGKAVLALAEDPDSGVHFDPRFVTFAEEALQHKHDGDKAQLEVIPEEWKLVSASNCFSTNCAYVSSCGYIQAMRRMRSAHVVVANHSMVGFDVALSNKTTRSPLLGPYDVLVLDEAHNASRYIRDAFANSAHEKTPDYVKRDLERQAHLTTNSLTFSALKNEITSFFARLPRPTPEKPVHITAGHVMNAGVRGVTENLKRKMDEFLVPYKRIVSESELRMKAGNVLVGREETKYRTSKDALRRFDAFGKAVQALLDLTPDSNTVCYLRTQRDGATELIATPLKVGPYLKQFLYPNLRSVVATSATITVNGSFYAVKDELGLTIEHPQFELKLKSPFDFEKRALLYVSRLVPEPPLANQAPAMKEYASRIAQEVVRLARLTEGRAFVLFTASKELEATYQELVKYNLNIKKQDAQTKAGYLQTWFREEARLNRRPVLLGLKSFWEGVSIEGDDLSLVVIVKLPFPQQDPLYEALCKKATDPFNHVTFPMMVRELQQGTGRLIRTMTDKGIVAILDRRLTTKPYSGKILNSLPFARPLLNLADVESRYKDLCQK